MVALILHIGSAKADPNFSTLSSEYDIDLALLHYQGGHYNPRPHGLPALAQQIRLRTSINMAIDVPEIDASTPALFLHPLLVWQGDSAFQPLPESAIQNLRYFLHTGGHLFIDVSDGRDDSDFLKDVRREISRILPEQRWERLPREHVLYKSFYLLDRHGGRILSQAYLEGIFIQQRLAVVLTFNDLAGAMAKDSLGMWEYDVGSQGARGREMAYRLGVNWVMYALCLDYKEDQVHLPFILQRRR